jgi:hypothetical protein
MAISFSGGGSWSTRREPSTLGKQLVNFITDITEILLKVALNTNYSKLYQTTCWGPFHIHIKVNLNKIKHQHPVLGHIFY